MKTYLHSVINNALKNLDFPEKSVQLDNPKDEKHGDITTNVALTLSKELKQKPRDIAQSIMDNLDLNSEIISKVELAGAGFINFFISDKYYVSELLNILLEKNKYGKSDEFIGKKANLEWVSANPTGPLHLGHGRQVCLGKAIANLLECVGYDVTREYYYNDAGNQMENLGKSVYARYMQIIDPNFPFPEDGYVGDYIKQIAQLIYDERKDSLKNSTDLSFFKKAGENYNFKMIRGTLNKLGIHHDIFSNESQLYTDGKINKTIDEFIARGLAYEKDGALWLKMDEKAGFDKDKVIRKSTGEPTYRLPDMAYHIEKIKCGYDLIIDIFGSDHGDTYKEVLYGVQALGYDTSKIKVIIHQMVTFKEGTESVKMSKRSDKSYPLDGLIEEVGADAVQFFFVMRGANTHLDFDIALAKEHSDKNPVYYLQYAHARICGILRNADENFPGFDFRSEAPFSDSLIGTEEEIQLLKILAKLPEEVSSAAASFEPHKIITYLNVVAERFHKFYHNNRVLDAENRELSIARLKVCLAAKQILKNGFEIIGISAPERM
ncbi:MAG: arginine--tRNA ligase [Ignavibacteria bacterium]|nr:arginine--tRNA ligase [Ignavibacteria bacterium]